MIFKWKKKASKQELFDIIKIQEEIFEWKNPEGLYRYCLIQEAEIERLHSIIREVREYIASFTLLKNLGALEKEPISISELKHILELLNIGANDKEN